MPNTLKYCILCGAYYSQTDKHTCDSAPRASMPNPNEVMDVEKLREEFNGRLCDYVADQYEAESHWALTLAQDSFYDWIVNTFAAQQNAALLQLLVETSKREAQLLKALGDMYGQYCSEPYGHDFMGAGEDAITLLEYYGVHSEDAEFDKKTWERLDEIVVKIPEQFEAKLNEITEEVKI